MQWAETGEKEVFYSHETCYNRPEAFRGECAILTVFPVDAKEYIALLPLDENGQNESGEVYLYAFARTESGDPMLSNIESDEEYAKAAVAFDTVLQNAKDSMDKIDWSVKEFHM